MLKWDNISKPSKTVSIIPAAGFGYRMGSDRPKQFLSLDGKPILAMTLMPFQRCREVDEIIVVVPTEDVIFCREEIVDKYGLHKVTKVVAGGRRRQDSVRLGLEAVEKSCERVLVHDGARPLVEADLLKEVILKAQTHRAIITGLPAKETVKEVDSQNRVLNTHERGRTWLIQTPQIFRYKDILLAHQRAHQEVWGEATDDSMLVEKMGVEVTVMLGSEHNIKITTPYDLDLATFLLKRRKKEQST
ncbi:MAG: 2-C-methyl-D-erythritol 4-phosphate cytidylyltransferase [Desulfatiglans sp.]|jgi:2-C-methyl-D-erythritol 4-phosphate cytidylyltransferase|nr:2-C-methyl-D-erythritol 4-phosphate cytidylyltransferase [Desulfatiglans sp.]